MAATDQTTKEEMSSEEKVLLVQHQLPLLAALILDLDLEGYIQELERAEAFTPILNPTLAMHKFGDWARGKELAYGALEFQRAARKLRERTTREAN